MLPGELVILPKAFEQGLAAGEAGRFAVRLVRDEAGVRRVGIVGRDEDGDYHVSLTPRQARELATWLRRAAQPK